MSSPVSMLQVNKNTSRCWSMSRKAQRYCRGEMDLIIFLQSRVFEIVLVWHLLCDGCNSSSPCISAWIVQNGPEKKKQVFFLWLTGLIQVTCTLFITRGKPCSDWLWSGTLNHSLAGGMTFVFKNIYILKRVVTQMSGCSPRKRGIAC